MRVSLQGASLCAATGVQSGFGCATFSPTLHFRTRRYEKAGDAEKLAELEKKKKLHVDNICTTAESRTVVNSNPEPDKIPAKEVRPTPCSRFAALDRTPRWGAATRQLVENCKISICHKQRNR